MPGSLSYKPGSSLPSTLEFESCEILIVDWDWLSEGCEEIVRGGTGGGVASLCVMDAPMCDGAEGGCVGVDGCEVVDSLLLLRERCGDIQNTTNI